MGLTCPKCFRAEGETTCERCGVRMLDLSDPGDSEILMFMLRVKDRTRWTIASIVGGIPGVGLGYLALGAYSASVGHSVHVPNLVLWIPGVILALVVNGILGALARRERAARKLAAAVLASHAGTRRGRLPFR